MGWQDAPLAESSSGTPAWMSAPVEGSQDVPRETQGQARQPAYGGMTHISSSGSMDERPTVQGELLNLGKGIAGGSALLSTNANNMLKYLVPGMNREKTQGQVAIEEFDKANSGSGAYQLGKIGTQVAGTAGIPLPLASGAQGLARIPQAIGNVGTGATTGAVAGGLIDGEEGIKTGAEIGAIITATLPPAISGIAKGVGWINDAARGNLPKIHAAKIMRDAAGSRLPEIQAALNAAPEGETAAQAAYGVDNDVWQALGEMAKRHDKEAVYRLISDKQKMEELSVLAKAARGTTPEESAMSRDWMLKRLEAALKPVREGELRKADFAGKVIPEAERRAAVAEGGRAINPNTGKPYTLPSTGEPIYTGRAGAIQNAGQLYGEFGNQANQAWKTAERKLGAIGDVKIARNTEQGVKNYEGAQEFVDIAKNLSNEIKFNQKVIGAVEESGLKPLNLKPVTNRIDAMLLSKTTRMSDAEVKVLGALKDKLSVVNEGGIPDAFALYELRKKGINEIVDTLEGSGQLTKKSAEAALLKLRPMIDNALEEAGATQWTKGYLTKYSKGRDAINRVEVADALRTLYDENPAQYIRVVRGKEPQFIENLVPGQKGIRDLFSESTNKNLQVLAMKAERKIKMQERASGASTALTDVLEKDAWKVRLPSLVDPKFSASNKLLEYAETKLDRKTKEALVKGMQSGKNASELIMIIPTAERKGVLEFLAKSRKATLPATSATISATQGQQ